MDRLGAWAVGTGAIVHIYMNHIVEPTPTKSLSERERSPGNQMPTLIMR